jgi:hypothetical protein
MSRGRRTISMRTAYNKLTSLIGLITPAFWQWFNHNAFQMAAALAYYTLISLAPLIIILIAIVGPFFGTAATENYIVGAIAGIAGEESARAVQAIVHNANQYGSGVLASAVGVTLLLLGRRRRATATIAKRHLRSHDQGGRRLVGFHSRPVFFLCNASSDRFSSAGIAYCHNRLIGSQQIFRRSSALPYRDLASHRPHLVFRPRRTPVCVDLQDFARRKYYLARCLHRSGFDFVPV